VTVQEMLDDYPDLEKEDIQAALLYAADLVNEEREYAISKSLIFFWPIPRILFARSISMGARDFMAAWFKALVLSIPSSWQVW